MLFLQALKARLRFNCPQRAGLTTEDLFSLPLNSATRASLESVAQTAHAELQALGTTSFVKSGKSPATTEAELRLNVVKAIIADREEANTAKAQASANTEHNAHIDSLIAANQATELSKLSTAELLKLKR